MKSCEAIFLWFTFFYRFCSVILVTPFVQSDKTSMFFNLEQFCVLHAPVIEKLIVLDSFECLVFCMRNKRCTSVNFAFNPNDDQRFLCQLLTSDVGGKERRQVQHSTEYDHFYKNPCADNPCQNSGSCEVTEKNDFNCTCTAPYSGRLCEQVSWIKVNKDLCFGAKDNSFGTFFAPSPGGRLVFIKLVHINGTVTCDKASNPSRSTFWGCFSPSTNVSKITTIITNENNKKLLPTYSNNLKGFHGNATAIVFSTENLQVFDEVTAGQEFRIWYYEDFANNGVEQDNEGLSCAEVYVLYWP